MQAGYKGINAVVLLKSSRYWQSVGGEVLGI